MRGRGGGCPPVRLSRRVVGCLSICPSVSQAVPGQQRGAGCLSVHLSVSRVVPGEGWEVAALPRLPLRCELAGTRCRPLWVHTCTCVHACVRASVSRTEEPPPAGPDGSAGDGSRDAASQCQTQPLTTGNTYQDREAPEPAQQRFLLRFSTDPRGTQQQRILQAQPGSLRGCGTASNQISATNRNPAEATLL